MSEGCRVSCIHFTKRYNDEPCMSCYNGNKFECNPHFNEPPLIPRQEFIAQRLADVANAIARYADARMDIPAELMSELDEWWKELY